MTGEPTGLDVPLALAAAGAALVWLGLFVAVLLAKRPPRVRAKDTGMELPEEPPAVAGLLANDFVVAGESAPAVVLDLADRRVLDIDEVQPGNTVARVRKGHDEDLTPYEHRVLRVLKDKAIDGLIPAEAMTTGPEEQSKRWQRALEREIVADAHARGLTHNRWTPRIISLLAFALAPAGILVFLAMDTGAGDDDWLGWAAGAVAGAVIALGAYGLVRMGRSLAQTPTERGIAAAGLVAGLETHLRGNEVFADLPPAAVKLRGRHFAYAAAFGFAPLAVALLPMGAEDDHRAWSRVGGRWRRVHVRYPRFWPPAWGKHPAFALLLGLFWTAFGLYLLVKLDDLANSASPSGITQDDWRWVELIALVLMLPVVIAVAWGLWVLVRALGDLRALLGTPQSLTGEIVRSRRFRQWHEWGDEPKYWHYLAVDDGSGDRVVALRLRRAVWSHHSQGEHVTARVTPYLKYVREVKTA